MIEPVSVARRFCAALDEGDWLAVAELSDADTLREFADDRVEHARSLERGSERHAHVDGPPDAPPEVRKWFAERVAKALPKLSVADEFSGVETVAELEKLTPPRLAAKALQGVFGLAQRGSDRTWLGVVIEGTDFAHVLYRFRFHADPDTEGSIGVLSMQRTATGWGVLWNGQGPFGVPGFGPNPYIVGRVSRRGNPSS